MKITKNPLRVLQRLNNLIHVKLDGQGTLYELRKIAQKESAEFIYSHIDKSVLFKSPRAYWLHQMKNASRTGLLLEFGVYKAGSINLMANYLADINDKRKIYGFDSFEGLSEDWAGTTMAKGKFHLNGELPDVLPNVKLIKGLVNETLLPFFDRLDNSEKEIAYLHLDLDVYTPTKYVLENTIQYLKPGSIIDFDDLIGYPGWKQGEYKALQETLGNKCKYEFIAYCEKDKMIKPFSSIMKAAIKVIEI